MNPNPSNRKRFIGPALIVAAMVAVMAIVVISTNLSSPEAPSAYSSMADITAARTLRPAQLTGALAPPEMLKGRIMAVQVDADAFSTPFFDASEKGLTLKGFKGSGLIVNFWATWCVPCVKEMPSLDRLAGKLDGSEIKVMALSVDRRALEKVPAFYTKTGIKNLDIYFDKKGVVSKLMGVKGLPTTVLIKADGSILGSISGTLEWDDQEISDYLGRVLAAEKPVKQ